MGMGCKMLWVCRIHRMMIVHLNRDLLRAIHRSIRDHQGRREREWVGGSYCAFHLVGMYGLIPI